MRSGVEAGLQPGGRAVGRVGSRITMSSEILSTILSLAAIVTPVGLLLGLVLLAVGLRGRRVDDHPLCARCRFDLIGLPGAGKGLGAAVRCPECGSDVSSPRRLRTGNHARRPRLVSSGSAMLLAAALGCGLLGYAYTRGTTWYTMLPSWALVIETASSDASRQRAALTELTDRITHDRVRRWLARSALEEAYRAQQDTDSAWLVEWGDLVEAGWHAQFVTPGEYREFLRRGVELACRVNPIRDASSPTAGSLVDVTPLLFADIRRVGVTTSVELRAQLLWVQYGSQKFEGNGNEAEMLTLGQSKPVILPQAVEVQREGDVSPRTTARFRIVIRGTERDDAQSANLAEIQEELEFPYDPSPAPGG